MALTVIDNDQGYEIHIGQSEIVPYANNVTIFARDAWEVQKIIDDLMDEYNHVDFTNPTRCADHKWGAIGRVW